MPEDQNGQQVSHNFALIALLKTLHEEGHDSWGAFSELSLAILENGQNLAEFTRKFFISYQVEIPNAVVYTVMARLSKKGLIAYARREGPYTLTAEGQIKSKKALESASMFKNEFDVLIEDLKKYLAERGKTIPNLQKEFINFIDANLAFTVDVVTGKPSQSTDTKVEIATYIAALESRNRPLFTILQNIFFGRLYLQIFNKEAPIGTNASFAALEIYLDTNIIFCLLGIQEVEQKDSLITLLNVLQQNDNIRVKALDSTISEAKRTLISAANNKHFLKSYKVDNLSWRLKNQGYDSLTITALTENLEARLEEFGVSEDRFSASNTEHYAKKVRALSEKYGQEKSSGAIDHDAEVLTTIAELRKGNASALLEKSRALFLTTDRALLIDSKEISKQESAFPLCVSTVELTCLVWLKNMGQEELMEAALRQALMIYAREKMLESNLWEKFIQSVSEARANGELTEEEVALIVMSEHTKALLFEEGDKAVKEVISEHYIGRLKSEQNKQQEAQEHTERNIKRIEDKKTKIAHIIARTVYVICSVIVSALIFIGVIYLISLWNFGDIANVVSVAPAVAFLIVFNFGTVPKLDQLKRFRSRAIGRIESRILSMLQRVLY